VTSILLVFDGSLRSPIRAIRAVDENGYDEQNSQYQGADLICSVEEALLTTQPSRKSLARET